MASFDDTAFDVDVNGYVTLIGGGVAATNIDVDASTAPGTDPVVPSMGNIIMTGAQVAAGVIGANVIRTDSLAANTVTIEIQRSAAVAATDSTQNGVAHFDSSAFAVDANGFVTLAGGTGPAVDSFTTDVGGPIVPSATGVVDVTGTSVFSDGTVANTLTLNVQATANTFLLGAGAGTTATELGPLSNGQLIIGSTGVSPVIGSLSSTNGSVTITPGAGTIDLAVAASDDAVLTLTGDAGGAVSPTSGDIDIQGVTVANAANAKPVFVQGTPGSSLLEVDVQVATERTGTPANSNDAGLSSYNDTQFAVDANGYVTLVGGADLPGIQTLTGDDAVITGPDASGNIDLQGLTVANATNAKPLYFNGGTNSEVAEIQVSTEITGPPADMNDAGICSFDDTEFTVDANGYVQLAGTGAAQTITGDSGGALSPTGSNWDILGRSGSKTSGAASTLTIKSPPYADQGVGTVTLNSGSFVTGAVTITLPASAGLADGDLIEIIATNGVVVVQLVGTQVGHLGADSTSAAGTFTGSSTGDVLCLRYQASTGAFWATSAIGVWSLA